MQRLYLLMAMPRVVCMVHQPPVGFFLCTEVQGSGGKARTAQPDSFGRL